MVVKTGKHPKRQYGGTKKRPALQKARISRMRVENGISVVFKNRNGVTETAHAESGDKIHDHFFRNCDNKHLKDYHDNIIETEDQI